MSSRQREQIKESLKRKGFLEKDGSDHWRFIYINQQGLKTSVYTKMSRGSKYKTITDNLLGQMSKQCKLPKIDFLNLVDCPLTREEYEIKLQSQNIAM